MVGGAGVDVEEEEQQGKRWVEMWMTRPSGKERGRRVAEANHSAAVGGGEEEESVAALVEDMSVCLPVCVCIVYVCGVLRMKRGWGERREAVYGRATNATATLLLLHILGSHQTQ